MSTSVTILDFVNSYTSNLTDTGLSFLLFDEIMRRLGQDERAWLATSSLSRPVAADGTYTLEASLLAVRVLAVFFADRELSIETERSLEAFDPQWRDRSGAPRAWTSSNEDTDRIVRLVPAPDHRDTAAPSGDVGDMLSLFYTQNRFTNIPDYLDLPIMLLIVAREFERESNHRDTSFADVARALALDILDKLA